MKLVDCIVVVALVTVSEAFKDSQDGAKILPGTVKDSYSIPLRSALKGVVRDETLEEFNLLDRMKTVEIPPSRDSTDFYASTRRVHSVNRFNQRTRRSPEGGLKFDGQSSKKETENHPKSIQDKLPRSPSLPQSSSVSFDGPKDKNGNEDENKRFFGFGSPYGHHGGGYYPGGHPYYPTGGYGQGHHGYPGPNYGSPHYQPGGYYGNGMHPGYPGMSGGSSSAAAAAASSSGNQGFGGLYGGGGNGYYPGYGNGYYGGGYPPTYPIINAGAGYPPPGHFGAFGFRDDKDGKGGKVSAGAVSDGSGKGAGGVSFE